MGMRKELTTHTLPREVGPPLTLILLSEGTGVGMSIGLQRLVRRSTDFMILSDTSERAPL